MYRHMYMYVLLAHPFVYMHMHMHMHCVGRVHKVVIRYIHRTTTYRPVLPARRKDRPFESLGP